VIRSKVTLSRYLDGLESEGVITCKRLSHKNVVYKIAAGEESAWMLAAHGDDFDPSVASVFKAVLNVGDKAKALDIAVDYAFRRFYKEEIKFAIAKIMAAMPEYRRFLLETMDLPRKTSDEDWSGTMIRWRARRYDLFLRNLRTYLLRHPEHLKAYLRKKPWLHWPADDKEHDLQVLRQILSEKYPQERLALEKQIRLDCE
jgi:hypothetical protein